MSKKSLLLLFLVATLPALAFAWFGLRVARAESLRVEQRYRLILQDRLSAENRKLQRFFADRKRELSELVDKQVESPDALRQIVRDNPYVQQVVILNREGDLVHPRLTEPMNSAEREFLNAIAPMIDDKDLIQLAFAQRQPEPSPDSTLSERNSAWTQVSSRSNARDSERWVGQKSDGWLTWYWGRGINLMYWQRTSDDRLTVIALPRARWMSDLLAVLPETQPSRIDVRSDSRVEPTSEVAQRICLVDSSDEPVYQWGRYQPSDSDRPAVEANVVSPLSSWRLKYYLDQTSLGNATGVPIVAGVAGLTSGLLALVVVLYREYAREMREAKQQVNFVNQVSHELKTPLTNIRLYADLLEDDLARMPDQDVTQPLGRLEVITSESQRLSRLISNVLTFARADGGNMRANRRNTDLDTTVLDVVERFRPALEAEQIQIELSTGVKQLVRFDRDLVEQILGNLISNVQRYAAAGKYLEIQTRQDDTFATVEVSDRGPGIPASLRLRAFEPFVRGSTGLSDATGTGIGLTIARRLAQLQGGELTLVPSGSGATFRLSLPIETDDESAVS